MTPLDAVVTSYKKYFIFSGYASRREYWWFLIFVILCTPVMRLLDMWTFGINTVTGKPECFFSRLFILANCPPLLSAGWRRLHDTGRPGWYILAPWFITVVIILLLLGDTSLFTATKLNHQVMNTTYSLANLAAISSLIAYGVLVTWILWCLSRPGNSNHLL